MKVTEQETLVYHVTAENKQQSLQWKHTGFPKGQEIQENSSCKKDHVHHLPGLFGNFVSGIYVKKHNNQHRSILSNS